MSLHIPNKICNKYNFRIYSVNTKVVVFKGSKQITENMVIDNNVAEQIKQLKYSACTPSHVMTYLIGYKCLNMCVPNKSMRAAGTKQGSTVEATQDEGCTNGAAWV
jgi:hypothetical protein